MFSENSTRRPKIVMVTRASARKKLRVKGPLTAFDEFIMGKDNGLRPRTFSPPKQRTFTSLQIAPLNIQCHMTFTLVSPLHCESFSSRACSCADIHLRTANSFKPPAAVPRSEAERRRLGLVCKILQKFAENSEFCENYPLLFKTSPKRGA